MQATAAELSLHTTEDFCRKQRTHVAGVRCKRDLVLPRLQPGVTRKSQMRATERGNDRAEEERVLFRLH